MSRISGPLLDRIDIHIEVPAVKFKDLSSVAKGEKSSEIRKRVVAARKIQMERFKDMKGFHSNSDMGSKEIRTYCQIDQAGSDLLKMAMTKLGLSARAYDRILKVSLTIADHENNQNILPRHLSETI
jgi:magnesium chelatase family protein